MAMKMKRTNMAVLCLFLLEPKKSSVVSSMGLLIARAVGQAPAIKVASKGFFQLPQKWRQKRPPEIKRLERSLLCTFWYLPLRLLSLTHLPAPIVNATALSSSSYPSSQFALTNKYWSVFTILIRSPSLSLIMMRKSGDLWELEKLLEIFWQNCPRMTSYVPLDPNKRGKPISDICNFTTMPNNDGGQYYLETFLDFSLIGRPSRYIQAN